MFAFYASVTIRTCRRHGVFGLPVCASVLILNTISYKPLVGISTNLQLWCSWAYRWVQYQKVRGQGHSKTTWL